MPVDIKASVKDLLKKLAALAERGVGGEAANAQRMLDERLTSLGLTMDDLLASERNGRCRLYTRSAVELNLATQIMAHVKAENPVRFAEGPNKQWVSTACTAAEEAEMKDLYDYYRKAFREETRLLMRAFISQHQLYAPKRARDEDEVDEKVDPAEVRRIMALMSALATPTMARRSKQLEAGDVDA